MTNTYHTIEREGQAEYKDRGSRFLAYAFPCPDAEAFKKRLRALREEHPKAVHHCYAWRIGTGEVQQKAGDDGEPAGSAGRPILGVLQGRSLTYAAVVVVRYFGGTLLGVPGLIQAYKTAASLALQVVPVSEKPVVRPLHLEFDYTMMNEVMLTVRRFGCSITRQEAQLFCTVQVEVPLAVWEGFTARLSELQGLQWKAV